MEKPGTKKKQNPKPSKKDRYERFQQTARDLGVDDDKSARFSACIRENRSSAAEIISAPCASNGSYGIRFSD